MNELDLLRDWPTEAVRPSAEVRAHARAQLERAYSGGVVVPTKRAPAGRRFGQRLAIAALAAAVLIAGAIVWAQRQVDDRIDRVQTVTVPNDVLGGSEVGKTPVNILVVGSDSRAFVAAQPDGSTIEERRTDTIILLHIDATSVRALWLPRDLMLDGKRINATFNDGPAGLIAAIKTGLGMTIDHYAEVDFAGFERIVDEVGGVRMFIPGPVRDEATGLNLDGPACRTLDGRAALAWVRARHVELLENGVWSDALSSGGDLYRQVHQQEFVRALAIAVREKVAGEPAAAVRLVDAVIPALRIDSGFGRAEILGLARVFMGVDPATVSLGTVPVRVASDGARVDLVQPAADDALAPFRGEAARPAPAPGPATTLSTTPVHPC